MTTTKHVLQEVRESLELACKYWTPGSYAHVTAKLALENLETVELAAQTTCPCTLAAPCSDACTCANPLMSGGCTRCATYGSDEQRKAMAEHIASQTDIYPPLKVVKFTGKDGKLENGNSWCSGCGEIRTVPHTWRDCTGIIYAEVMKLREQHMFADFDLEDARKETYNTWEECAKLVEVMSAEHTPAEIAAVMRAKRQQLFESK